MSGTLPATVSPWRIVLGELAPLVPRLGFILRTSAAVGLALGTAFFLQLLSPMSAVTTVLIVASPNTGALISKSLWRLFGTVLGAAGAVVLMALFAQTPVLFTVALALCIGLACFIASLLRFFRAYAAILAGYTVIIVASGAFATPDHIFIGAVSRMSAVGVGLASAALVFLLTTRSQSARVDRAVAILLADVAEGMVLHRNGAVSPEPLRRAALLARLDALDETLEYAIADSWAVRRRGRALRNAASRLAALLALLDPLPADPAATADPALAALRQRTDRDLLALAAALRDGVALRPTERAARFDAMQAALRDAAGRDRAAGAETTAVGRHETRLLEELAAVLAGFHPAVRRSGPGLRLPVFLDWFTAGRNAARGALLTLIAGLAWYVTRWTAGPTLLAFLVPAACIVSTAPSAAVASAGLASGVALAVPVAAFFQIAFLPRIAGFPLLWFSLCLCLAPGLWLQFHPRWRGAAVGYAVFFNAMVRVNNPVRYDDPALLNGWLAFLIGAAALPLVFRVMLPPVPWRDAQRLRLSLVRAVRREARRPRAGRGRWEHRQMQKVFLLQRRLNQVPGAPVVAVEREAFRLVALGRTIGLLRDAARTDAAVAPPVRTALDAVAGARRPEPAMRAVDAAARTLRERADGAASSAAALLDEAAALMSGAARLLDPALSLRDPLWRTAPARADAP